nr:protein detoxification 21 [Quercus suber]
MAVMRSVLGGLRTRSVLGGDDKNEMQGSDLDCVKVGARPVVDCQDGSSTCTRRCMAGDRRGGSWVFMDCQDEDVAKVGGVVAHWIIGAMFALVISYSSQMYLQSQSKNMLITYFAAFAIVIHVLLSWLLTVKYNFGVPGAMLSTVLAFWIPNIGQLMFIMCGGCRETWKGFSSLAFQDLWAVMKLSLSSGVMLW